MLSWLAKPRRRSVHRISFWFMKRRWFWALAGVVIAIVAALLLRRSDDPRQAFLELVGFDLPDDSTVIEFKDRSGVLDSNAAWHIRPGVSSLKALMGARGFNPDSEMQSRIGKELAVYFPTLNPSDLGSPWHRDIGSHGARRGATMC